MKRLLSALVVLGLALQATARPVLLRGTGLLVKTSNGTTIFEVSDAGAITTGSVAAGAAGSFTTVAATESVTADQYRVTNATTLTAANPQLTKAEMQGASFWGVTLTANAVDVDLAATAMDAADVGTIKRFVVTTGHATQALTVTAGAGITTVNARNTLGTTCEDVGDYVECIVTTTATATCTTICAD